MRKLLGTIAMLALIPLLGCPGKQPAEKNARDTIAAATGAIQSAQTEYKAECTAAPVAPKCVLINDAVHGQNAAITSVEAYCGFQVNVSLPADVCVPVKTAAGALTAAIGNLGNFVGEIQAIMQAQKKTAALRRARDIEATMLANSRQVPTLKQLEAARIPLTTRTCKTVGAETGIVLEAAVCTGGGL